MVSVGAPKTRFPSCKTKPIVKTKPMVSITPMRQTIPRAIGQGLAVALTVCVAAAHGSTPQALEQASAGAAVNDAATAASKLEAALGATPDDERLYQQLSELYDQKALDYDKALDLYQRYLQRFPSGHLLALFKERQLVLQRNRAVWPLLARYRRILQSSFERRAEENWPVSTPRDNTPSPVKPSPASSVQSSAVGAKVRSVRLWTRRSQPRVRRCSGEKP